MNQDILFLETIVKAIVKYPDSVRIKRSVDDSGVFLQLWVSKDDMGLVIGKGGEHASALKLLVKLRGLNLNTKTALKIEEPL